METKILMKSLQNMQFLAEKIDNLATITDTFRDNQTKIQTELSDKLTQKNKSSEKSLTEDKKIANKNEYCHLGYRNRSK